MAKNKDKDSRPIHIYGFESKAFYVNIKAHDINDAINQFKLFFGSCALTYVKQITSSDYVTA